MKIIKLVFFIIIIATSLYSQKNYTISGFVRDSITGETLIGASIYEKNSENGCLANSYGFYSLTLKQSDTINLTVSFIGYVTENKKIIFTESNVINFSLKANENQLNEITVTGDNSKKSQISITSLSPKEIKYIPMLGGERDIFKAFQLMPGISQGTEGQSGLYVRGGSPDQNLVILDDIPIYYIDHFGGFVSNFNDDAINDIKLIKGGFPSQYGNRLSSVIDIRMKEGNMQKFKGNVSIGIMSSKISFEGPVIKNKISYIVSVRRFMLDLIMYPFYKITKQPVFTYNFYDVNTKINFKISDKSHIFFSFYKGNDKLTNSHNLKTDDYFSKTNLNWGNTIAGFRWNYIVSKKIFTNLTLSNSNYNYLNKYLSKTQLDSNSTTFTSDFKSKITDYNAKYDISYYIFNNYTINCGLFANSHKFTPGTFSSVENVGDNPVNDTIISNYNYLSYEYGGYIENKMNFADIINTNLGIRINNYIYNNKNFLSFEPRLMLNFNVTKNITIKTAYSLMQQNIHLLTFNGDVFNSDLWLPATDLAVPENATQYNCAADFNLFNNKYFFSIEGYYKKMNNLLEFEYGDIWNNAIDWENKVEKNGEGISKGIELFFNKKYGKLTGWLGYTISKNTRQFENINSGKVYNFNYDRTHDFKIFANYSFSENVNFSASWIFQTGRPFSLAVGFSECITTNDFDFENNIPYYSFYEMRLFAGRNTFRMKPYHRLDIALSLTKEKKRGVRTWNFSIYNLYNRQNPYYYFMGGEKIDGKIVKGLYQQSFFPIIPSVSYSFKF